MPFITKLFELSRPLDLLLTALCYGLGLGMARYLGVTLQFPAAFVGGAFVVLVLAAARLLAEHFRFPVEPFFEDETPARRNEFHRLLFTAGLALLVAAGFMVALLLVIAPISLAAWLFIGAVVLTAMAFGVPPVRLLDRGFGEFGLALVVGAFTPALGFSLQTDGVHRLLPIVTFPLFALALSCLLAFDFPDYATDLKHARRTLLIRLGWQRAIPAHNIMLGSAYLFLAAGPFFGLSFALLWPAFLTLPLAAYQVFMLARISDGARPVWPALKINAAAIFGLTAYLLTLTFWLR